MWLEPYPDDPLDERPEFTPGPDARYEPEETIALAFVAAVQHLPPRQRAVLLLRDVLGFRAAEVAGMLDTSRASVDGALRRARATMARQLPGRAGESAPPPLSPREQELAARFAAAYAGDDIDGITALLTDDAWFTMPLVPLKYQGRAAITAFLRENARRRGTRDRRLIPTRANGQPAYVCYLHDSQAPIFHAHGLIVLTLAGDRIRAITRFVDNGILARFGFPRTLPE